MRRRRTRRPTSRWTTTQCPRSSGSSRGDTAPRSRGGPRTARSGDDHTRGAPGTARDPVLGIPALQSEVSSGAAGSGGTSVGVSDRGTLDPDVTGATRVGGRRQRWRHARPGRRARARWRARRGRSRGRRRLTRRGRCTERRVRHSGRRHRECRCHRDFSGRRRLGQHVPDFRPHLGGDVARQRDTSPSRRRQPPWALHPAVPHGRVQCRQWKSPQSLQRRARHRRAWCRPAHPRLAWPRRGAVSLPPPAAAGMVPTAVTGSVGSERGDAADAVLGADQPLDTAGLATTISGVLSRGSGTYNVVLNLHPPELGQVQARLSLRGDMLQVDLSPEHAATHDALESALPDLREHLAQGGVEVDVTLGDPGAPRQARNGRRDRTGLRPRSRDRCRCVGGLHAVRNDTLRAARTGRPPPPRVVTASSDRRDST